MVILTHPLLLGLCDKTLKISCMCILLQEVEIGIPMFQVQMEPMCIAPTLRMDTLPPILERMYTTHLLLLLQQAQIPIIQ
jgi:hypothetical protein